MEDIEICSDCPPIGYPTDKTRCAECPCGSLAQYPEDVKEMYEAVMLLADDAYSHYRKAPGLKGQVPRMQDGLEFWVMLATLKYMEGIRK